MPGFVRACLGPCVVFVVSCGSGEGDKAENGPWTTADPSCASGQRWAGGDEESVLMHPGSSCIACHDSAGEGPSFTVAGTVYAAPHELADCFGASGAQVVITGADGVSVTLSANAAGNFEYSGAVVFPLHAQVAVGSATREMQMEVPDGDCNHCHTESGEQGAPGRILLP